MVGYFFFLYSCHLPVLLRGEVQLCQGEGPDTVSLPLLRKAGFLVVSYCPANHEDCVPPVYPVRSGIFVHCKN